MPLAREPVVLRGRGRVEEAHEAHAEACQSQHAAQERLILMWSVLPSGRRRPLLRGVTRSPEYRTRCLGVADHCARYLVAGSNPCGGDVPAQPEGLFLVLVTCSLACSSTSAGCMSTMDRFVGSTRFRRRHAVDDVVLFPGPP